MTSATGSIQSVYGTIEISDPLARELIDSPPFQRLKEIHQYGVVHFIEPTEAYSRFDHSLGVYWLLRKIDASREEQIAGLLHDVSHTVFSHVGDYVFQDQYGNGSYQDDIHLWFLKESGISTILERHGFSPETVYHRNPHFTALDRPLPHLCADRLEYNIQGGLLRGLLTQEEFDAIAHHAVFSDGSWVLHDLELAEKLGRCSLVMTETLWGSAWEALAYRYAAEALRKAFEISLVSFDEFHFSTDLLVWNKLSSSSDPLIRERVSQMKEVRSLFSLTTPGNEDLMVTLKFRGIDPYVQTADGRKRVTEASSSYAAEYKRVQQVMESGWPIKFHTF